MSALDLLPQSSPPGLSARQRFLSRIVDQALTDQWRSAGDFLEHFPPRTLIESLKTNTSLRVTLLVATTGVNERLAERKTVESAAEDLFLSLDEGLTSPSAILALLPPDERARHLDAVELWNFATDNPGDDAAGKERANRELKIKKTSYLVDCALEEGLLRLQDVTDGLGFHCIATSLPHAELQRVVEHALSRAREGQRLTEEQLLQAVPLKTLMKHVPQERTWERVVLRRLAIPLGFVPSDELPEDSEQQSSPRASSAPPPVLRASILPPSAPPFPHAEAADVPRVDPALLPPSLLKLRASFVEPTPSSSTELAQLVPLDEDDSEETQIHEELSSQSAPPSSGAPAYSASESPARGEAMDEFSRVTEALQRLHRLPSGSEQLSLLVLLSIESMYEELEQTLDEEQRLNIVREAFPNENHLRVGLTALIRLLDPDGRTNGDALHAASSQALIETLLFEESRLRHETEANSARGSDVFHSLPDSSYS